MSQINVSNLTFTYEGSFEPVFENVSFSIDTNWKLGFIGRNGKGKTTFLNLLLGKQEYQGSITASTVFEYFPYNVNDSQLKRSCAEFMEELKPACEVWRVICELNLLEIDAEVLYRPFETLSFGERTKVMLALLFSGENEFLLIDEPTNHLDQESREVVKRYLQGKKGFILVSHDRDLLDACIDHVLVLNRKTIEVQTGNFSSWWENKTRQDHFAQAENEKHLKEIGKLKEAALRTRNWADQNENTKIGFNPVKEHDRCISTRAYIGAKTKKMQSRVKQMQNRISREIEEKEGLLQDIENPVDLKLMPLKYYKEVLVSAREYGIGYLREESQKPEQVQTLKEFHTDQIKWIFRDFGFEIRQGERVFLHGKNGCGKSSLIHAILGEQGMIQEGMVQEGMLQVGSGLVISYINQDTSHLRGSLKAYAKAQDLDESLFLSILRQLDLERVQFQKNLEDYSEGQKKKVLIAGSLLKPAHLYIWDEPLNYIDVFSRMQIEKLILQYRPTMLIVDHDVRFREKIATKVYEPEKG